MAGTIFEVSPRFFRFFLLFKIRFRACLCFFVVNVHYVFFSVAGFLEVPHDFAYSFSVAV